MTLSADHIVILILLLALVVKFIFFENKEELAEQLRVHMSERLEHLDHQEYNQLNRNLRRRFTSGMPFFRSQSFFLDRAEFEDDAKDGKYSYT